jgi:hypothetical protein
MFGAFNGGFNQSVSDIVFYGKTALTASAMAAELAAPAGINFF